jgi:ABC-type multidrug transport system fused ATPase/permease subunit
MVTNGINTLPEAMLILPFLGVNIYFLWRLVGIAMLAGIGVLIILGLIAVLLGSQIGANVAGYKKVGDERIGLIREMLNNIKMVKFRVMEKLVMKNIIVSRMKQLSFLKKMMILFVCVHGAIQIAPQLVMFAIFALNSVIGSSMNANIIFPALAYLGMLLKPLNSINDVLTNVVGGRIALQRVQQFLKAEELEENNLDSSEPPSIVIENATVEFYAKQEETGFQLKNIDLNIAEAGLNMVIGATGSGKTSLFSAILGDMKLVDGTLSTNGSIAVCTQEPYIVLGTIEENILFGKVHNPQKMNRVVHACGLDIDLQSLPNGLKTEIGERGVNLSGGQQSRVALARALYSDADIYLLDCPLAALDAKVAKFVFKEAIVDFLKDKIVLMATHKSGLLPYASRILVTTEDGLFSYEGLDKAQEAHPTLIGNGVIDLETEKETSAEINQEQSNDPVAFVSKEEKQVGTVRKFTYARFLNSIGSFLVVLYLFSCLIWLGAQVALPLWLARWSSDVQGQNEKYYLYVFAALGAFNVVSLRITDSSSCYFFGCIRSWISF